MGHFASRILLLFFLALTSGGLLGCSTAGPIKNTFAETRPVEIQSPLQGALVSQPQYNETNQKLNEAVEELKLRVALLENTVAFYKEAMFSARFMGNGQAKFDRDRNDKIVGNMFEAQQAITSHDYTRANQLIDEALAQDEYLAQAWLLKGSLRYLQADFSGAKQAWERCLKIDPYDKTAYTYLGKVYEKLGLPLLDRPANSFRTPATTLEIEKKSGKSQKK